MPTKLRGLGGRIEPDFPTLVLSEAYNVYFRQKSHLSQREMTDLRPDVF